MSFTITGLIARVKAVAKVLVGILGLAAGALNEYLAIVPDQYKPYVTAFIAVATALGIYHAPYAPLGRKSPSVKQPDPTVRPLSSDHDQRPRSSGFDQTQ